MKTARLMKRQEKLLDKFVESREGQRMLSRGLVQYDDLPADSVRQLERVKDKETLWSDAERYLGDRAMEMRYGSDEKVASEIADITKGLTAVKMPHGMKHVKTDDWPYAVLTFRSKYVEFGVQMDETGDDIRTGKQPYLKNAPRAIEIVFDILKRSGVPEENIEVL